MHRALTVVIALSVLLAACGSSTSTAATDSSTTAPSTSTPPTTVAATTTSVVATSTTAAPTTTTSTVPPCSAEELSSALGHQHEAGRQLVPGCYYTDAYEGRVSFVTTQFLDVIEFEHALAFGREGVSMEQLDVVLFAEFIGVLPPSEIGVHPPHDEPLPATMVPMPEDLGTWLDEAPQIVVLDSGEADVDGDVARWWDVTVDASLGETFTCPFGNCIAAPFLPGGNFVIGDDSTTFRIMQLSGAADGLFVWIQAVPEKRSDLLGITEMLLSRASFSL